MKIDDLGWNSHFKKQLKNDKTDNRFVGRVANAQKSSFLIYCELGERIAKLSGLFSYQIEYKSDIPVVGDWVELSWNQGDEFAIIHSRLARQNKISRAAAGNRGSMSVTSVDEQVIAANIDTVFLVSGLDRDFNVRRIERYLALAFDSGATPVIILNKADLFPDPEEKRVEVESIAIGVPVLIMNAQNRQEIDPIKKYLFPGYTATFLGSSGVGKSTIINGLLGIERQKVNLVSKHVGKGQHTTTTRELIMLPEGGMVVDTPGMRELQLFDSNDGLDSAFEDMEKLTTQCRFSDCGHQTEPGCAILNAIETGSIDAERVNNYFKLKNELFYVSERQTKSSSLIEKEKWKKIRLKQRRLIKAKR